MREINSVEDPERAALAGSEGGVEQALKTAEEIGRERVEKTLEKFQSIGQKVSRAAKFLGRLGSKVLFRVVAPVETAKEAWSVTSEAATKAYQYTSEKVRGGAEKVASGAVDRWYNAVEKKNEIAHSVRDRVQEYSEQRNETRKQKVEALNDANLRKELGDHEANLAGLIQSQEAQKGRVELAQQVLEMLSQTIAEKQNYVEKIKAAIAAKEQELGVAPEMATA